MIFEKVKTILAEELGADEETITLETAIDSDLGADSLDVVQILVSIQNEFGIEIPDEEIENLRTVGELVDYIQANA